MIVRLSDYMRLCRNGDATPAVLEALLQCRREKNSTLLIDSGEYHFYPQQAIVREYFMSNNDGGRKAIAFPLIGFDGLTVEGGGADFIFHGKISPFVIDACKNVTVRNLSIDYPRPFFSQARILASHDGYTDLRFDEDYPYRVENGKLVFCDPENGWDTADMISYLVTEFDAERGIPHRLVYLPYWEHPERAGFLGGLVRNVRAEALEDGVVRLYGEDRHRAGAWWVATHGHRDHPGFFIQNSRNTVLEDVTLYHCAAMGVIGQTSENITLRRVRTALHKGRLVTVNADATHFVHCSGTILLEGCHLCNMLDDAGNFHGNYATVERVIDKCTFVARLMHGQQQGVMIYRPGDVIALVDRDTLARVGEITVSDALMINEKLIRVIGEDALPGCIAEGMAVENFTQMPEVIIRGCEVGWNRPRGFLISTCRRTLIEDCTFANMHHGVHLTGDANSWFESGCVRDLTIRNCRFLGCGYTEGAAVVIDPAIKKRENNYYHGNIVIEDNLFESDVPRFLRAMNAENITVRHNRWRHIEQDLPHDPVGENGFEISFCRNVEIEQPETVE